MPFPRAHRKLVIFGDAWTQQEIWQTGIRLDTLPTEPPTDAQMQALLAAAEVYIGGQGTAAAFSSQVRLLGVEVQPVGVDGKYGSLNKKELLRTTPLPGTNIGACVPQQSVVISLTTGVTRGTGHMGRCYPPPQPGLVPEANGRIPVADATTAMNRFGTFLSAVNAAGAGVASVGSIGINGGAGTLRPITGLRCGRVVDTQRRRRNQIPEEYAAVPLA